MKKATPATVRCAIYTRKSTEEGLEQAFNSLDAQREACEAYIRSQAHEGWVTLPTAFDDGGFSGGNIERPALRRLLDGIQSDEIDLIIVYKVDRLSRSLADFVRLIELLEKHNTSFVSVTQQFNTANSMGRLTLNVLLSFAQFEREVTSERIRDKIAASKKKGIWMGGTTPFGYDAIEKQLVINKKEAHTLNRLYNAYLKLGNVRDLKVWACQQGLVSKTRTRRNGTIIEGAAFARGALYALLKNPLYIGKIRHHQTLYEGLHDPIVAQDLWDQVQQVLASHRVNHHRRVNAKVPSVLAGLVIDDKGNVMSPTHTKKGKKRYRYYVSQAILQYEPDKVGSVERVPAEQLESAVITHLIEWLENPSAMIKTLTAKALPINHREQVARQCERWQTTLRSDDLHNKIPCIQTLLKPLTVSQHAITLKLNTAEIIRTLQISATQPTPEITHTLAAQLKRTGIEKRLVINNQKVDVHPRSVQALQRSTLLALKANLAMLNEETDSIKTFAKQQGINQRNLGQLMKLAYLPPETLKRIAQGELGEGDTALQLTAIKTTKAELIWN